MRPESSTLVMLRCRKKAKKRNAGRGKIKIFGQNIYLAVLANRATVCFVLNPKNLWLTVTDSSITDKQFETSVDSYRQFNNR